MLPHYVCRYLWVIFRAHLSPALSPDHSISIVVSYYCGAKFLKWLQTLPAETFASVKFASPYSCQIM